MLPFSHPFKINHSVRPQVREVVGVVACGDGGGVGGGLVTLLAVMCFNLKDLQISPS